MSNEKQAELTDQEVFLNAVGEAFDRLCQNDASLAEQLRVAGKSEDVIAMEVNKQAERRQKQYEILLQLPPDMTEQLYAQLMSSEKEQEEMQKPENDTGAVLRGMFFEAVVQKEFTSKPEELAELILALAHSPERFDMKDLLKHFRNPDLAYIEFDAEKKELLLLAGGESKLGKLNQRAFYQLNGGFKEGISGLIEAVAHLDQDILKQKGLGELAGVTLKVADNYKQILFVPAERDVEDPDSFINRKGYWKNAADADVLAEMLKPGSTIDNATEIKQSCFSGGDIKEIVEALVPIIEAKYNVDIKYNINRN